MELFKHWHPVIESDRLRKKPISVELCGQEMVVFRTQMGKVGVLQNRCCHRGMRLSCGWVEGEKIICPYHGWKYTCDGQAFSPGTPKLNVKVPSFTAIERYGFIWIKEADSEAVFPDFKVTDDLFACVLTHEVQAPLEMVLDNFTEIEHTPSVHTNFGYDPEKIAQVETRVETTEESVRVNNKGIQQPMSWIAKQLFFNISSGDWFFDNWETFFSPLYTVYDQFWIDPTTDKQRPFRLKLVMFFVPINEQETRFMMFVFTKPFINKTVFKVFARPIIKYFIDHELKIDKGILDNLADKKMSIQEMQLGRFDRALMENRKRINRIYRGSAERYTV